MIYEFVGRDFRVDIEAAVRSKFICYRNYRLQIEGGLSYFLKRFFLIHNYYSPKTEDEQNFKGEMSKSG